MQRRALAIVLILGGCAAPQMAETPMTAAEMPVAFEMNGLSARPPEYHRVYDSARGTDLRQMVLVGGSKFAIVSQVSVTGNYVLKERSTQSWIASGLGTDQTPSWGQSGSLDGGAGRTKWQAFDLADRHCLGLTREADWHGEAGGDRSAARAMIVAIYCRTGTAPLEAAEAERVAAAIRPKSV